MKKIILFANLLVLLTSCQTLPASQAITTPTFDQPTKKYYDPTLGFSLEYPNTWKENGVREFKGDDGYLKIHALPDYHSLSADHVCSDYVYKNVKGRNFSLIRFGSIPGCMILEMPLTEKSKAGDKVLGISRIYNSKTFEYDYFLLESTYPHFMEIISSLVIDRDFAVPDTLVLPTPKSFQVDLNRLQISETFIKAANFNGEDWNLQNLVTNNENRDYTQKNQCGQIIKVDNRTLTVDQSYNQNTGMDLIEVKQEDKVIFSIDIFPSPSADVWAFCEWKGNWFLETSDFVIQNGEIANHKLGYDEMFGWQILAGRPFYFFTKDGIVYVSYDEQILPTEYNFVPHYRCCEEGTIRNPHGNDNEIWFLGVRNGAWYYVDIQAN